MTSLTSPNLVATGKFGHFRNSFRSREMKCPFNKPMRSAVKLWETTRLQMIDT